MRLEKTPEPIFQEESSLFPEKMTKPALKEKMEKSLKGLEELGKEWNEKYKKSTP